MNPRAKEAEFKNQTYRWAEYKPGWPRIMELKSGKLPTEDQFSWKKTAQFDMTAVWSLLKVQAEKLYNFFTWDGPWPNFEELKAMTSTSTVSAYVEKHWREDAFFGYQCLNGVNPMVIRKCSALPENFAVTDDLVKLNLSKEMKKGKIFMCDYKILEGVETNNLKDNDLVYLAAPLVLFHLTPEEELKPVAIQLKQKKSQDNPVFVPSDSEWILAKMFARSADFTKHQLDIHLLRTHLLAEVFSVSLMRNFEESHYLYKLLFPHTRYTLEINHLAREHLINEGGVFSKFSAASVKGIDTMIKKSLKEVTYSSLCIRDNVTERGMERVPNYYYRDDGFKLWDIIYRFVEGVIKFFTKSDAEVKGDSQLQNYIQDIFEQGFLSNTASGIPQSLEKVEDLIKFVTMVIFTGSAQHAAVNNGQFDFGSWMPNSPTAMKTAPPSSKGTVTDQLLMPMLPCKRTTANAVAALTLLSTRPTDFEALGTFPNTPFTEEKVLKLIKTFQDELEILNKEINIRNLGLDLAYDYLKPSQMENSITI